jgi:hypothetical protein
MLGNGYCARPVEMDCHFESICESCTFFVTCSVPNRRADLWPGVQCESGGSPVLVDHASDDPLWWLGASIGMAVTRSWLGGR